MHNTQGGNMDPQEQPEADLPKNAEEAKEVKRAHNAMGLCISLGAAIGTAIGVAMDNVGIGIGLGVFIGTGIGAILGATVGKP
jgi:uncharacterized membrane protein